MKPHVCSYSVFDPKVFLQILGQKRLAVRDEFALYSTVRDYISKRKDIQPDEVSTRLRHDPSAHHTDFCSDEDDSFPILHLHGIGTSV